MQRKPPSKALKVTLLPSDPYESARIAGLRYVTDEMRGIRRRRAGSGFVYLDPDGRPVRDRETLGRIRALVIPPAWSDVWICPIASGHMQAVGKDARGRKQYRYHTLYRKIRDATKFTRMIAFGLALPRIRAHVAQDLERAGLPREKVLATIICLLEQTCIRVGNEEYRKQNESFGLTTLRDHHVQIHGRTLHFHFKGKSGQVHDIELTDRRLARIVRECQWIPGRVLFQYLGEDQQPEKIGSEDVNDYLREITGEDFTAKDFRTWNGSREAVLVLESIGPAESEAAAKRNSVEAVKATAERLTNRPATCRKYYIHPAVLDAYADGSLFEYLSAARGGNGEHSLRREEAALMNLLNTRGAASAREATRDDKLPQMLKASVAEVRSRAKRATATVRVRGAAVA